MADNHRPPSPVKLLLVDDEIGFAEVIRKRMAKRGVIVEIAGGGSEAIQLLRTRDFDIAVLDLKMEDMDGLEVLKIFKKMVPEMPVIMLTGHGSETAAKEGIHLGAFDYLTKPCELDDLLKKISDAVKTNRKENVP